MRVLVTLPVVTQVLSVVENCIIAAFLVTLWIVGSLREQDQSGSKDPADDNWAFDTIKDPKELLIGLAQLNEQEANKVMQ